MGKRNQAMTPVRLVVAIAVACVVTTFLAGPPAEATDGYGVSAIVLAEMGPAFEGRSVSR